MPEGASPWLGSADHDDFILPEINSLFELKSLWAL